jgi:TonB family protein
VSIDVVSDVLVERARETENLTRMVLVSLLAHVVLLAGMVLMPAGWRSGARTESTPMTIVLGGVEGPDSGGKTPIAGRPVDEVAPPNTPPKPDVRPAPKAPEMVEPTKVAPKTPPKTTSKNEEKSASKKATSGPELKKGSAVVNTGGAQIPFGGLSTGGGSPVQGAFTDYADFCCPEYLNQMTDFIKRNWNKNQGASGSVQVKFTIQRDGTITNVEVEKPSNIPMLDLESQRALLKTQRLPTLPREFTPPTLTVHLIFEYLR